MEVGEEAFQFSGENAYPIKMKRTELKAKQFLEMIGHENPIYEPDGNVPPDFLTQEGVAVEVRALNQVYEDEQGNMQGLETADVSLRRTIQAFLNSYTSPLQLTTSYGLFYRFRRPIPSRRVLERELRDEFDSFLSGDRDVTKSRELPCGIGLRLFDWGKWKGTPFRLAGNSDYQRGGWVVQQLAVALSHALRDKEAKVASYKHKYPRWWLVLIDQVTWGTDENDRRQLREVDPFNHTFDRVFIVNDERIDEYFEL